MRTDENTTNLRGRCLSFRAPLRPIVVMATLITLFVIVPRSDAADSWIDDQALKNSFTSTLNRLFEKGGLTAGADLVQQLQVATKYAFSPPQTTPAKTPQEARERALSATLIIGHLYLCEDCGKRHATLAGGVLISPNGLALTNYHVLDSRAAIVFGAMTSTGQLYPIGKVLAASAEHDIALIQLRDANDLPWISLAPSSEIGDELFVISHPDNYFFTYTRGYLSRKYLLPEGKHPPRLQITADFAKGSSGCGIYNLRGEMIGLVASTNSIYYTKEKEKMENLQMVIKSGVPTESILELFTVSEP